MSNGPEPYLSRPGGSSLNYADPALIRLDRERRKTTRWAHKLRRAGIGAGLALILLGYAEFNYRGPGSDEVFFCWGVGGLLFGASLPSIRPRPAIKR